MLFPSFLSPLSVFLFDKCLASTDSYTLSLHDALPISLDAIATIHFFGTLEMADPQGASDPKAPKKDRKSTRLNSSHRCISYAVFCLKKKKYHRYRKPAYKR